MNRRARRARGASVSMKESRARASAGELPKSFDFPCPFCGRMVTAEVKFNAVVHPTPMCPAFEQNDALGYMRLANEAIAAKRGATIDRTNPEAPRRKPS